MDKKIAIDLIKLDVLNLSSKQDFEALNYLKRKDDNFPWKELGEYQNLTAAIAVTSKLETPPDNLKIEIISKAKELKKHLFLKDNSVLSNQINSDLDIDIFNKSTIDKKNLEGNIKNNSDNILLNKQNANHNIISNTTDTLQQEMVIPVSSKISTETILSDSNLVEIDKSYSTTKEITNGNGKNIGEANKDLFNDKQEKEIITFKDPDLLNLKTLLKNRPNINWQESEQTKEHVGTISINNKSVKPEQLSEPKAKTNYISTNHEIPDHSLLTDENITSFSEKLYDRTLDKRNSNTGSKRGFVLSGIIIILSLPILLYLFSSSDEIITKKTPVVVEQKDPIIENQINVPATDSVVIVAENPVTGKEEIKTNKAIQDKNQLPPLPSPPKPIETSGKVTENTEIVSASSKSETLSEIKETKLIPPVEKKSIAEETPYFVAVEEMPEPIGGITDIQKRVVYPKIASLSGVEGRVIINAYVSETGNVTRTEVVKGIGAGCDEAAVEAVLNTKFKPGKQRGNPVNVRITIPILFKKH
ncbi:MAG: energy transducer TonB [Ignavibacteriaceae bacterium]